MENFDNERVIVITFGDVDVPLLIPYIGGGYIPTGKDGGKDTQLVIPPIISGKRQKGELARVLYGTHSTWFTRPNSSEVTRVISNEWNRYTDLDRVTVEVKNVVDVASKALLERTVTDYISPYMPEIPSFRHRYTDDGNGDRAEIDWTDLRRLHDHIEENIPYFKSGRDVVINFSKAGDVEISYQRPCDVRDVCEEFDKARRNALVLRVEQNKLSDRVTAHQLVLNQVMNK